MATWKVTQLEREADDGLVVKAHWRIEVVDGNINEFTVGVANLGPRGSEFIEFEDLTEETIVEWLKEMPELIAVEVDVINRADAQREPETIIGLPW